MKILTLLIFCLGFSASGFVYGQVEEEEAVEIPNELVFEVVEELPVFPGGEQAMMKYIADKVEYPKKAIKNGVQGAVYIQFVVEKDGSISDARVLRGIGAGCDEESLRVIESMPKWSPGKQKGKEVRVRFVIPIRYKL